jgi:hypothetical protein
VEGNHGILGEVTPIPSEEAPCRADLPTSYHCFPFVLIVRPKPLAAAGIYKTAFSNKNNPSQSSAEIRPPVIKPLRNRSPVARRGSFVSIAQEPDCGR